MFLTEGNENGVGTGYIMQNKLLKNLTENARDILFGADGAYQDMLEDIF